MSTEISGTITNITFHHQQTHYTVLRLSTDQGEITVVGIFPSVTEGETLRIKGEWETHPQFGRQFKVREYQRAAPISPAGIKRYLSSGIVPGIGPGLAQRVVDRFGTDTLRIIAEEPERLAEIAGLGPRRRESLVKGVQAHKTVQEMMVFLQGLGVSGALAGRIYKRYGDQAMQAVRQNPYRLADEIFGVGFRTADQIAMRLGVGYDSVDRARAAVLYQLQEAMHSGHMCLPLPVLIREVEKQLNVRASLCEQAVTDLAAAGRLTLETIDAAPLVYLPRLHLAERETARLMMRLARASRQQLELDVSETEPATIVDAAGLSVRNLSAEQLQAVRQALSGGVTVITGGPGTGKTTILRLVLHQAQTAGQKVLLAAPTGRAAKRLQEATGAKATTIHRLLEYGINEETGRLMFRRNARNPLTAQLVIIDEVSMLDMPLAYQLLLAIKPGTGLVLVGDADQLPSVGPGSFLRDLIAADCVPVIRLNTVFRQAEAGMIVTNAHRINRGLLPIYNRQNKDFYLIVEDKAENMAAQAQALVAKRLPRFLSIEPAAIQVLTPVRKGPVGVNHLNRVLQRALNPRAALMEANDEDVLLVGDKVMQIRNNYEKMVFNGDMGVIVSIDAESDELTVDFPDREEGSLVTYTAEDWNELQLAYATSIHKSQGSEYPVVVVMVPKVMPDLMTRNLLYTAVTRARRLVVLVGDKRTIAMYVKNDTAHRRYGGFVRKLTYEAGL
ncbi:MAG TPA: ATP-dependent RecD-like DNA helicase [Firmicutes bacterium]|jgi:exodeoxyribonuclease V alpha subunit|nr:ATP-dependent RecD-like DNA helicase [Bacillota bacterium]